MKRKFIICFTIVISVGALLYFGLDFGKKYVIEKSIEKITESDITAKEQFAQYEENILKEVTPETANQNTSSPSSQSVTAENTVPSVNPDFIGPIQQTDSPVNQNEIANQPNNSNTSASGHAKSLWDEPLVKSVAARFSQSEIAEMTKMAAGGFTAEEKSKIKSIVYSKVSQAEISELKKLYYTHSNK